jgi:hypothetical protein
MIVLLLPIKKFPDPYLNQILTKKYKSKAVAVVLKIIDFQVICHKFIKAEKSQEVVPLSKNYKNLKVKVLG